MTGRQPHDDLVTVVIPARNEEAFIGPCLQSVLVQDHPHTQILVVDGSSTDRTPQIVREYARGDPRVELLVNPDAIIPKSLNLAVARARGRWLVRVDAHATVPRDYVRLAVDNLRSGEWAGVGGRKDGVGVTAAGRAIAVAMRSPFGVGNSVYHHGSSAQQVDHVPFGAYDLNIVRGLGGWDEQLAVNQDFEFDHRLGLAGLRLWFDPRMKIHWHCRQSVPDLFRQYHRYGRGKVVVLRLHPRSLRPRHLAAPALVAALFGAGAVGQRRPHVAAVVAGSYLGGLVAAAARDSDQLDAWNERVWLPASLAAMHVGWGLGFWRGVAEWVAGKGAGIRRQPAPSDGTVGRSRSGDGRRILSRTFRRSCRRPDAGAERSGCAGR